MANKKAEKWYMCVDRETSVVCEGTLGAIKDEIEALFMDETLGEGDLPGLRILEVVETNIKITKGQVVVFSDERE